MPVLIAAAIGVGIVGCSASVTATPAGTSSVSTTTGTSASATSGAVTSTGSSSTGSSGAGSPTAGSITAGSTTPSSTVAQPNLVLDITFARGSAAPSDVELGSSISAVLGDVPALSEAQRSADLYLGSLDGRRRVFITLPDATTEQLDAAQHALVGTRTFGLRPVVRSIIDAKACTALQSAPKSNQLCDQDTKEVLTLGADLGVVPTRVQESTEQGSQPGATLDFSATDAKTIATYTAAHVGDRLAMTDGLVLVTAPSIQAAITDGRLALSGGFTSARAAAMVGRLQLAALGSTISAGS